MPTPGYNRAKSVIIKNAIILNIMHDIFNIRDTEVVKCKILVDINILTKFTKIFKFITCNGDPWVINRQKINQKEIWNGFYIGV
jgi:hypothetical protein